MLNSALGASTSLTMLTDDPVAMLVPLPNEETKTLIGEKEFDEISELSERQSLGTIHILRGYIFSCRRSSGSSRNHFYSRGGPKLLAKL